MNPSRDKTPVSLGRIGSYELVELIGRGGMGVVYKAKQIGLERIVAVKTILDAHLASPDDKVRFRSEAKAVASLMHPGIVAIHEIGEHDGQPYYSMDFVDGPTLGEVLKNIGPQGDVYSLGAVLYAALTGFPPFRAASPVELLRCTIEDLPVRPSNHVPTLDRDLETICLKCLEKRIGDRYMSAGSLADDLSRYLNGDPVTARPPGYGRNLWHWARRPQRTSESATIVLVIAAFFGSCFLLGLCILFFEWVPTKKPAEAAFVFALDFTGFAFCLPVGLGILAARRWLIFGGLLVGFGVLAVVFTLIGWGFDAGGLLADPLIRVVTYSIFGFVACLMIGANAIALVAHSPRGSDDSTSSIKGLAAGSTQSADKCASTEDVHEPAASNIFSRPSNSNVFSRLRR